MAFVVHSCPVKEVLDVLNEAKLGASLQTSGDEKVEIEKRGWSMLFPCMLTCLWCVALVLDLFYAHIYMTQNTNSLWMKKSALMLFIFTVCLGMCPVLKKTIRNINYGMLDINGLMAVAVAGAVALKEWTDAGLVVVLLAWAAELESSSMRWVRNSLTMSSATAAPTTALLKTGQEVIVSALKVGDIISVRAGEQIPVDGKIHLGKITVDEGLLTGESSPILKTKGCGVLGGTLCTEGYAEVVATAQASSSTLSTIAQMVEEAGATTSRTQMTLDRVVIWYVPVILSLSFCLAVFGPMITKEPSRVWVLRSLVVLISACPCALTIAGMVPSLGAISRAAANGVLVKSCDKLDRIADLQVLAFDKTGTLTEGKFKVSVSPLFAVPRKVHWKEEQIMQLVASLESKSSHPLAASIVSHVLVCVTDKVDTLGLSAGLFNVKNFQATEGMGVSGIIDVGGHPVDIQVGNSSLLSVPETLASQSFRAQHDSATLLFVKLNGELQLALALSDTIRANARECVRALHRLKISTTVLTGDNEATLRTALREVGIADGKSKCKPIDKLHWVTRQHESKLVCGLIGDGINDSPALKAADVGLAMGAGSSSMAVSSADVVFMSNDLLGIVSLIGLSQHVRRIVKENIALAAFIKGFVVILAFFGYAQLWMAVMADCGSLLLVLANGLRPFYYRFHASEVEADNEETRPLLEV